LAMSVLKPPGQWGETGADIVVGEGQPLGAPLSSGGPYFGFMCCSQALVRQMPGRIIGKTVDLDGKPGYALTLQAREQHIRRSKATSNICTNQGLLVTAATIHMSLLGAEGLARVAASCHENTAALVAALSELDGVQPVFDAPAFHERVLRLPMNAADALKAVAAHNILGGYDLSQDYPELGDAVLVCATELRTEDEIQEYVGKLSRVLVAQGKAKCPVEPKFD
jgi:glycine dehydrogenase subunit 1